MNNIKLNFKGSRNYIHGADISNALIEYIGSFKSLDLLFYKPMKYALIVKSSDNSKSSKNASARLRVITEDGISTYDILENTNDPVSERYSYDEDAAIIGYQLDISNQTISRRSTPSDYTMIEKIVALNKVLMQNVILNEIKWAFARLELKERLRDGDIKLVFINNLGFKITKTEIYVDEIKTGTIYFSEFSRV